MAEELASTAVPVSILTQVAFGVVALVLAYRGRGRGTPPASASPTSSALEGGEREPSIRPLQGQDRAPLPGGPESRIIAERRAGRGSTLRILDGKAYHPPTIPPSLAACAVEDAASVASSASSIAAAATTTSALQPSISSATSSNSQIRAATGTVPSDAEDTAYFLTAKHTMHTWTVAWSFFATSVGAGILFAPAAFAVHPVHGAGWLGLVVYALMTGVPILVVAGLGRVVRARYPDILSLGDYVRARFGPLAQLYVTGLVLFNTSVALCTEYTAIGDLFVNILGAPRHLPILLVGGITSIYTIIGGLAVSIITDSFQGAFSVLLLALTLVYLVATFRPPGPLPPLPPYLALNAQGWGSLVTLGISMPISAIFTDATWQRVWSSVDDRALLTGATLATGATAFFVFCFGFGGFLASWSGIVRDPNTAFFALLAPTGGGEEGVNGAQHLVTLLVILIAVAMNESAVDSFQTALTDTVVSLLLSGAKMRVPLGWVRVLVLALNVPVMWVALQGYDIMSLYLITNLVTTTSAAPLLLGLVEGWEGLGEGGYFASCAASFLALVGLAATEYRGDVGAGMYSYFFEAYQAHAFLLALGTSVATCYAYVGLEGWWARRRGRAHRLVVGASDALAGRRGCHLPPARPVA